MEEGFELPRAARTAARSSNLGALRASFIRSSCSILSRDSQREGSILWRATSGKSCAWWLALSSLPFSGSKVAWFSAGPVVFWGQDSVPGSLGQLELDFFGGTKGGSVLKYVTRGSAMMGTTAACHPPWPSSLLETSSVFCAHTA